MLPCLPQTDSELDRRAAMVAADRAIYRISRDYHDLPFPAQVPRKEQFSAYYLARLATLQGILSANKLASQAPSLALHQTLVNMIGSVKTKIQSKVLQRLWGAPRDLSLFSYDCRSPLTIVDYEKLFQLIKLPLAARLWQEDWYFAWQRLAGTNPTQIQRVSAAGLPDYFPVTPELFERASQSGDRLDVAIAESRLFIVEFSTLRGIPTGFGEGWRKYLSTPIALFLLDQRRQQPLKPICIQCDSVAAPGPENPIFIPQDGMAWQMAKTILQVADSNYHGVVLHGTYCHMMVGLVAIFTYRNLAPSHPIRILLQPHFQFTVAIDAATRGLFEPGGRTPTLQSVSLQGTLELSRRGLVEFNWHEQSAPRALERKGVLDLDVLPEYPYRDDTLLLWDAICNFVNQYVRLYYASDLDVSRDGEVQAWLQELGTKQGGNIQGIGNAQGQVETIQDLITFVAQIIHRATAYHAAINYSVFPAMGFAPNMPAAAYAPPPVADKTYTFDDFLALLPPQSLALGQIEDVFEVSNMFVNVLGEYGCDYFQDRRVQPLVAAFQHRLQQIEFEIETRNQTRALPYTLLLPSHIPASIHI